MDVAYDGCCTAAFIPEGTVVLQPATNGSSDVKLHAGTAGLSP
jgi:hypothetical protein